MGQRFGTVHRLVTLLLAVVAAFAPAEGRAEELIPGSQLWQQFIIEHIDGCQRNREAGEYSRAVYALEQAAEQARKARPDTSSSNDQWYLNLTASEAERLVSALASALETAVSEIEGQSSRQRRSWQTDPTLKQAIEDAEALQSAPDSADESMRELEERIRTYLGDLSGQPIRRYYRPEGKAELDTIVDTTGRTADSVCRSSSLVEARDLMDYAVALHFSEPVERLRQAALLWEGLVAWYGTDVELGGVRPSGLRRLVDAFEQQRLQWEADLAKMDAGVVRLEEAQLAATRLLRDLDHRLRQMKDDFGWHYRSAREILKELDPDAATTKPPLASWTDRAANEIDRVQEGAVWLRQLLDEARDARSALSALPSWIELLRGPEMLGRIDRFIAEANDAAAEVQVQMARLDDEIERGRRCLAALAGNPGGEIAPVDGSRTLAPAGGPTPTLTLTPPSSLPVPPPVPTPTPTPALGAAAPTVDPDVAGGLKITGPARIGVGWRVTLSATDHGGRPVSEVSWHSMADTIRVAADGTVVGLRPGRATVMATAHGMRAFFDFEVVADDGAPTTPGGPPALATPAPDVVVVPPAQLTPTPTPASPHPSDDRTTDWAEPTPTPWFVPEESDPRTGQAGAGSAGDDAGGGFADFGTEVVRGSDTSAPPSRDSGTPSVPIGPAGAAVAGVDDLRLPPDTPTSDGGFEDLGTDEISRSDAEHQPPPPDRGVPPGHQSDATGTHRVPPSGPQQHREPGEAGGSTETEDAATAADDGSAGSSEPTEGLTFLGETAGSAAAPSVDGPLALLPPPGEGSPGPEGGPPSPGSPPARPVSPPPGGGGAPFIPSRTSVNGAGQPAAYYIFATCSRLGWAGALATYSVGPADAAIADHLLIAGEHAMWANRTSYPPLPAWPDWQARRGLWGDWAARLARTRDAVFRGQIAHSLSTAHETLSQDLDVQMVAGAITRTPTCDAEYCRLGFLMAWGQQALAIAEEARRRGEDRLAEAASGDGLHRLRLARGRLPGYERIDPVTGRCADLGAIGGLLDGAIGGGGSTAARSAWETALAAVMALGPGQPPPSDGSLLGAWVLADGRVVTVTQQGDSLVGMADNRELLRVRPEGGGRYDGQGLITTRSGASEQARWYDGLIIRVEGDTAQGSIGELGFTMTRAGASPVGAQRQAAAADPAPPETQCPVVRFNGEIEGDWAYSDCCPLRFSASGGEWIGAYTRVNDELARIGHRVGQPVMRLRSTGPLTYEGTVYTHWSSDPVIPVDITVIVAGRSMIKKETRLTMDGLIRRSHWDTSGRLHHPGFWVGCVRTQSDILECSVESDPHPDVKRSNASGADRLGEEGYPIIVFGPARGFDAIAWILEHNGRPLCLDSIHPAPAHSQASPNILPGDLRMMGVEPQP